MENNLETLLLERLRRIEETLQAIVAQKPPKERYSIEEVADILEKAPFTVREWARNGRIHAQKRSCGRGRHLEWCVSAEELARIMNDGLLPVPNAYRYMGRLGEQ